ncbi:CGNR zinc finger domain-containing protein [Nonomuraea monospora]|uniref:CGNR zinc finger domain-containing protein n=1 Tax=Nonomuraea monospora TaxID=568818 RepID=A0ABP5PFX9_9ACTN
MKVFSTKAMAVRAVDLCVALLYEPPSIASVTHVLREHGETGELHLTDDDITAMRTAAAHLRDVLAAATTGEAAAQLNQLLAHSARPPRLTSHDGTTSWHLHVDSADDAPWAEWFLTSSAMALAVLLADQQRIPGGLCASTGCGRPYLDVGGGSPRRYCSTRCATRERVAAHRSRTSPATR